MVKSGQGRINRMAEMAYATGPALTLYMQAVSGHENHRFFRVYYIEYNFTRLDIMLV
jgi:hypothetical protein